MWCWLTLAAVEGSIRVQGLSGLGVMLHIASLPLNLAYSQALPSGGKGIILARRSLATKGQEVSLTHGKEFQVTLIHSNVFIATTILEVFDNASF